MWGSWLNARYDGIGGHGQGIWELGNSFTNRTDLDNNWIFVQTDTFLIYLNICCVGKKRYVIEDFLSLHVLKKYEVSKFCQFLVKDMFKAS